MKSGKPDPLYDLKFIIDRKRSTPSQTCEVVSKAAAWLKAQLAGCNIMFQYGACDYEDHYGYSVFIIGRKSRGNRIILELKVAEIDARPFLFAEVRSLGHSNGSLFPYFGEISTEEGRNLFLHYISDYILSTEPEDSPG